LRKVRRFATTVRFRGGVDSNNHITGFYAGDFEKMGEKSRRHFPNPAPKKALKPVKAVLRPEKKSSPPTPVSPPSPPFFPVALKNCQFLTALPSVDGAENGSRFIMVQGIISQPMILLSTGVSELTLGAE
jgi:hypothetical protein